MRAGKTELRGTSREGHTANRRRGWIGKLRSTATQRGGWAARLVTTIAAIAALAVLATPVAADDLVSNLGEMGLVGSHADYKLSVNDFVMPFTIGTNASGYRLESISIEFATSGSRTHDPVYVSLLPDNGSGRHATSGQIATLTRNGINYLGPIAGVNKYTVWEKNACCPKTSPVHLDANTSVLGVHLGRGAGDYGRAEDRPVTEREWGSGVDNRQRCTGEPGGGGAQQLHDGAAGPYWVTAHPVS